MDFVAVAVCMCVCVVVMMRKIVRFFYRTECEASWAFANESKIRSLFRKK
jgi:hypothetical protein